jgi:hypothetical protein
MNVQADGDKCHEMLTNIDYEALDKLGYPYWRKALRVGELPLEIIDEAISELTPRIAKIIGREATSKINFGRPIFYAFGMQRAEAKKHKESDLLLTMGGDLPLSLLTSLDNSN